MPGLDDARECIRQEVDSAESSSSCGANSSEDGSSNLCGARLPPDHPEVYRLVLQSQHLAPEDVLPMPPEELDDDVSAEEMLVCLDLATPLPKAAWSGDLRADWWAMNRNLMPVLSLCYSNPLHPYSRMERIVVFVVEIFWSIQVAGWAGIAQACVFDCDSSIQCEARVAQFQNFTAECHIDMEIAQRMLTGYCCSPPVLVASGCIRQLNVGDYSFGGMLFTTLLNSLFLFVSQLLMKCSCMQKKSRSVRVNAERAGYACFGLFGVLMLPIFGPLFYYLAQLHKIQSAIFNFFGGQIGSLVGTTAMNSAMFLVLRHVQMPKEQEAALKCFDPREGDEDSRNFVAKFVNPRYCVSAGDHMAWTGEGWQPPPRYKPLGKPAGQEPDEG